MTERNRAVVGVALAALLVCGCGAEPAGSPQTPSGQQTVEETGTGQLTAWPTPSFPAGQTQWPTAAGPVTSDVTVDDLLTAQSPDACQPSTRMVDGQVPGTAIGYVEYEPGHPWSPVYLDMAGLGYRQALSVFVCGGANPIPNHLMLTGSGGELLGSVWLGDAVDVAHGNVMSMEVVGDTVRIIWVASGPAGADAASHYGTVSYQDGRLVYTDDQPQK